MIVAAMLAGLVMGQQVEATPLTPLRDIPWTRMPPVEFPAPALSRGVDRGTVIVDCAVDDAGVLSDCRTTEDQAAELGFGRAALSAMRHASVDPARWTQPRLAFRLGFVSNEG